MAKTFKKMIKIDDKYYVTSDGNGYALIEAPDKNHKDPKTIGYSGTLHGIINIFIRFKCMEFVSKESQNTLLEIKQIIEETEVYIKQQLKV